MRHGIVCCFLAVFILLTGCDSPNRLQQDASIETVKPLVKDRLIAPLGQASDDRFALPEKQPRRQLLQVRYHEKSLYQDQFLRVLKRLAEYHQHPAKPLIASGASTNSSGQTAADETNAIAIESVTERERFSAKRQTERQDIIRDEQNHMLKKQQSYAAQIDAALIEILLDFESDIRSEITRIDKVVSEIKTYHVAGITASQPEQIFGMDLTINADGYLSLPSHLAFLGDSYHGIVSSKLGHARLHLDNINHSFHFSNLPLTEVMRLISHAADLQIILSPSVRDKGAAVTFTIEAGTISALDALFHQYDISMIYNPELEVAQIYTDDEFELRLSRISKAIENHNTHHHRQEQINILNNQLTALTTLLSSLRRYTYAKTKTEKTKTAQQILSNLQNADTSMATIFSQRTTLETWLSAAIDITSWASHSDLTSAHISNTQVSSRHPILETARQDIIRSHHHLTKRLKQFDADTLAYLSGQAITRSESVNPYPEVNYIGIFSGLEHLAIKDECITPGREIYTEKVAVYGGENAMTRISTILDSYFTDTPAPAQPPSDNDAANDAANDTGASNLPESKAQPPNQCQTVSGNLNYVPANDASGYVVTGYNKDIALLVRLVEQFDRPQRQVLIEVYMINVVKDFNRKLDLSFQTDALATDVADTGGFFLRRDLTDLQRSVTSQSPGGFVSGLISPNNQVEALVDFIETNNLGQTISSPTILVEEGGSASVTRTNTKPVTRVSQKTLLDSNNNLIEVPVSETVDESVSFTLDVADIKINPNNNNVTLKFALKDQSFETSLANVNATTGKTEDAINTSFIAAPGDVIILAGLFKQIDTTAATGLPGTTRTNLPTAFLLGGEDQVTNKTEEMIILMAPTVIEPEIGRKSPHSALD